MQIKLNFEEPERKCVRAVGGGLTHLPAPFQQRRSEWRRAAAADVRELLFER